MSAPGALQAAQSASPLGAVEMLVVVGKQDCAGALSACAMRSAPTETGLLDEFRVCC